MWGRVNIAGYDKPYFLSDYILWQGLLKKNMFRALFPLQSLKKSQYEKFKTSERKQKLILNVMKI